jgi:hypothetical protein
MLQRLVRTWTRSTTWPKETVHTTPQDLATSARRPTADTTRPFVTGRRSMSMSHRAIPGKAITGSAAPA